MKKTLNFFKKCKKFVQKKKLMIDGRLTIYWQEYWPILFLTSPISSIWSNRTPTSPIAINPKRSDTLDVHHNSTACCAFRGVEMSEIASIRAPLTSLTGQTHRKPKTSKRSNQTVAQNVYGRYFEISNQTSNIIIHFHLRAPTSVRYV